jgi:hypothetical protein
MHALPFLLLWLQGSHSHSSPVLDLKQLWSPQLLLQVEGSTGRVQPNDLRLGGEGPQTMLLTGGEWGQGGRSSLQHLFTPVIACADFSLFFFRREYRWEEHPAARCELGCRDGPAGVLRPLRFCTADSRGSHLYGTFCMRGCVRGCVRVAWAQQKNM